MLLVNRTKRKKVRLDEAPCETIPAAKAGGHPLYGAGPAVFEWFLLSDPEDEKYLCSAGTCCRLDEPASQPKHLDVEEAAGLLLEAESFSDSTQEIYRNLLEAERLATPEELGHFEYDMGFPIGYVERLLLLWHSKRDEA